MAKEIAGGRKSLILLIILCKQKKKKLTDHLQLSKERKKRINRKKEIFFNLTDQLPPRAAAPVTSTACRTTFVVRGYQNHREAETNRLMSLPR